MKIATVLLTIILSFSINKQNRIFLSPEISIILPKGANAFDDQKFKESMSAFGTGEAFKRLTKDIYKIDNIILRFAVVNGERSYEYLQSEQQSYERYLKPTAENDYNSEIKSIKGNSYLNISFHIKTLGHNRAKVYNPKTRKIFNIEIEYKLIAGEKEKSEQIMQEILESAEFK
ncbi:hypothetical protein HDE69_004704 [Pedobacter cryoconitis]|uniref:Uncharacterized protein n=1 Tax=Pedobacter cryoconitis TaxID=188932 RepID=A0A7W9DLU8_9SPHI|nr:hypothetical protein [Pedobacter cryoconitis]MBB5623618.1 hypothetical protein [Pedobacter cryoconitis]MBB5645444.1 hypothetical protein [Pedobacter cryoconitis]